MLEREEQMDSTVLHKVPASEFQRWEKRARSKEIVSKTKTETISTSKKRASKILVVKISVSTKQLDENLSIILGHLLHSDI